MSKSTIMTKEYREYVQSFNRLDKLFRKQIYTKQEAEELDILVDKIVVYEGRHYPIGCSKFKLFINKIRNFFTRERI